LDSKKKTDRVDLDGLDVARLLDRVTDYVLVLDGSLRISYANRAFRDSILREGVTSFRETLEEPCLAVLESGFAAGSTPKAGTEDYHLTVTHKLLDGGTQKVHYRLFPLDDGDGMVGGVGRVLHFAEDSEASAGRAERRKSSDASVEKPRKKAQKPFGELLSRSAFFDKTEKEVRSASRYRYPVSCLVIDIDNFSAVNERNGNAAGDFVIGKLARILQSQVRQSDVVAKYGGDEFTILAPHTDRVNARFLAERLRRRVQDTDFEHDGDHISITVSIGVATLMQATGVAGEELIGRAVTALREAQQRGMNRVVIYS